MQSACVPRPSWSFSDTFYSASFVFCELYNIYNILFFYLVAFLLWRDFHKSNQFHKILIIKSRTKGTLGWTLRHLTSQRHPSWYFRESAWIRQTKNARWLVALETNPCSQFLFCTSAHGRAVIPSRLSQKIDNVKPVFVCWSQTTY